jgi:transcriptional regulator with GAF, ATPase, and Fis domain
LDSVFWVRCGQISQAVRAESRDDVVVYGGARILPRNLVNMCARFEECRVYGTSPAMIKVFIRVLELAGYIRRRGKAAHRNVLIRGEIGSGKGLFAEALHTILDRKKLVRVNCGTLSTRDHMRSELLGHKKGAFTGAYEGRIGAIERAEGGTLQLDDIDKIPDGGESVLLEVLNEREFIPFGGDNVVEVKDVQFIATTNADVSDPKILLPDIRSRFNANIEIPSLATRISDTPLLIKDLLLEESESSRLRLPLALWCMDQVAGGHVRSIRELRDSLLPVLLGHLDGGMEVLEDQRMMALRAARRRAHEAGQGEPLSHVSLAGYVIWNERSVRSGALSDPEWRPSVERGVIEEWIHDGRSKI